MIKSIKAENYKSIKSLELELGRVNVFIGENGAGKSNILEVFALAGAALADKLDNEFLVSRGIRATKPEYMRSAFIEMDINQSVNLSITGIQGDLFCIKLNNDNLPYSNWRSDINNTWVANGGLDFLETINEYIEFINSQKSNSLNVEQAGQLEKEIYGVVDSLRNAIKDKKDNDRVAINLDGDFFSRKYQESKLWKSIKNFIIFSPENTALRRFEREGQIEPLGIRGEGLLKLLSVLSREEYGETLQEIKEALKALCWFEDFKLIEGDTFAPRRIAIKDRYIEDTGRYFDQMSANEGFLFLLFYFALFSTSLTPSIFAIDNIDASLNPALCEKLLRELVKLAKKHDKQVLLTTHNPAVLDGLNLDDDEQRLFVVSRNYEGETIVTRRTKRKTAENERPVRLSEMFLRGSLGGLPKGF